MSDVVSIPDAGYPDNGCVHNPVPKGCVNCPFLVCYHDDPGAFGTPSLKSSSKRLEVVRLFEQGLPYTEIATWMNLSERSILRHLAKHKARTEQILS